MLSNLSLNKRVCFALAVALMFAFLSVPGFLMSDYLKAISNLTLSFASVVFACGELTRINSVVVSRSAKLGITIAGLVLVSICSYLLVIRYI